MSFTHMKYIKDPYTQLNTETVIALGCFDGVHVAHRQVISEAVKIAAERGCKAAVWCFSEPPKNFFLDSHIPLICDEKEKARLIRQLGADILISPDFDKKTASVEAEDFVRKLLCENAGAVHLVCGKNYTFGHGGRGNTDMLAAMCETLGIGLSVIDDVSIDGVKVSSTLVREAIEAGQCTYAAKLLGREFSLCTEMEAVDEGSSVTLRCDKKYLAPLGRYLVRVSLAAYKKDCEAHIERTDSKTVIRLPVHFDSGRIRVKFLSNKLHQKEKEQY